MWGNERLKLHLKNKRYSIDKQHIAKKFADTDTKQRYCKIGLHKAEQYSYCTSKDRQESKETHPCATPSDKTLSLVKVLALNMQITLYPLQLAHSSYAIIE